MPLPPQGKGGRASRGSVRRSSSRGSSLRMSRRASQQSLAGGCMVKICLWVAFFQGWFSIFQAIWMTVDIPLDGLQSHMYRTASAFWDSDWELDERPFCNETVLKACWDNDVETCNGTVQFLDSSGNISNYTNPNDNNKDYTMAFNCKLRLNSAYFGICLFAWMLPPLLLATSYVWVEVS